jgi:hypothetical protein
MCMCMSCARACENKGATDRCAPGEGGESPEAVVQRGLEALRALGMYHREKRAVRRQGSEGDMNGHGEGSEGDAGGGGGGGGESGGGGEGGGESGGGGEGGGDGGGRHVCVVAHSRFNKLIIASLRGDVSQAAKVSQGNACVNVIDFSVGGGACCVVRLNVCDHLSSWTRPATPASVEDGLNSVMSVSVDDSEA